uniref:Uncharacterized protein n=1 Tax=Peronospora matthiolae TaxID=2874970 RepID=A0AAV1VBP1_9STRA
MPAGYYPGVGMPKAVYIHPGLQAAGMLGARHRKLAIQPFDGKELYHGPGSGFLGWAKKFFRQIGLAERAYGFGWPENIKFDVPGYQLACKAQTHDGRQVETWWRENQNLEHAMARML